MAPLSNLPEPDPCDGPPTKPNRTLGFAGTISNLPKPVANCLCGLLVINDDNINAYDYVANPASGNWTTNTIGDAASSTSVAQIINRGGLISYPGQDQFFISSDKGATWQGKNPPGNFFYSMHDRSPSGRYWTFDFNSSQLYYSDDEMTSWLAAVVIDFSNIFNIHAHPTDSNKILVSHDDFDFTKMQVTVSVDGGATWNTYDIVDIGDYTTEYVFWSNNRIVAFLRSVSPISFAGASFYTTYSDDNGVTWATPVLLDSTDKMFFEQDYRVALDGTIFVLVNQAPTRIVPTTQNSGYGIFRSIDGITWSFIDTLDPVQAEALAYCDNSGDLYILYPTIGVYDIQTAKTASSGSLLTKIPTGAYDGALVLNGVFGNMVTI